MFKSIQTVRVIKGVLGSWFHTNYRQTAAPENTHHRGKNHCMAALQFNYIGFGYLYVAKQSYPIPVFKLETSVVCLKHTQKAQTKLFHLKAGCKLS